MLGFDSTGPTTPPTPMTQQPLHSAQLIWATPDGDNLIAKLARVSNPANENNTETAPRLISYLIRNKHWSPFEMASMCVEIRTTRAISHQILRHRSFSFQEFSQRYAEVSKLGDTSHQAKWTGFRFRDPKNRQNSTYTAPIRIDLSNLGQLEHDIQDHLAQGRQLYDRMINAEVAPEVARFILPELTPTRLYMCGTVRSWMHYFEARLYEGTQLEHRKVAQSAFAVFIKEFPNVVGGFDTESLPVIRGYLNSEGFRRYGGLVDANQPVGVDRRTDTFRSKFGGFDYSPWRRQGNRLTTAITAAEMEPVGPLPYSVQPGPDGELQSVVGEALPKEAVLSGKASEVAQTVHEGVEAQREALIKVWLEKSGLDPKDVMQILQFEADGSVHWWLQQRPKDNDLEPGV